MPCIDQQSKVYHHLDELELKKLIVFEAHSRYFYT